MSLQDLDYQRNEGSVGVSLVRNSLMLRTSVRYNTPIRYASPHTHMLTQPYYATIFTLLRWTFTVHAIDFLQIPDTSAVRCPKRYVVFTHAYKLQ